MENGHLILIIVWDCALISSYLEEHYTSVIVVDDNYRHNNYYISEVGYFFVDSGYNFPPKEQ